MRTWRTASEDGALVVSPTARRGHPGGGFVPVGVATREGVPGEPSGGVVVTTRSGHRLEGLDASTAAIVVLALEALGEALRRRLS